MRFKKGDTVDVPVTPLSITKLVSRGVVTRIDVKRKEATVRLEIDSGTVRCWHKAFPFKGLRIVGGTTPSYPHPPVHK